MNNQGKASNIVTKAARSLKWAALTEIISRTASPIVTVILARFLEPEDYGIVATAMVVVSFGQMLWDAGLSKALIQTEEDLTDAAHVVFWSNLILGGIVYAVLFLVAPWVAVFFGSPKSAPVLRVLGLQIIISSLTSVQTSLFIRDMDFRRLMWVKLLTAFIPGLFSIPMAMAGHGVWALVAGTLAGQTFNLILLWHHSHWRPALHYNFRLAKKLMHFGLWILADAIGGWLQTWGDNLIVGRFLGVRELGVYRLGWTLAGICYQLVLSPVLRIVYPAFSRLQNDREALQRSFRKSNRLLLAIIVPIGVGLVLVGPEISMGLFGSKWDGLGLVLQVIGLMFAIAWMTGINPELYRAIGHPHANAILVYVQLLYYLPAYYFAAQEGLVWFVYVRLGVACVALPMHIYLCQRTLGTSWKYIWEDGKTSFLAALFMGGIILAVKMLLPCIAPQIGAVGTLIVTVPSGICIYLAVLTLLDRGFMKNTLNLLRQATAA